MLRKRPVSIQDEIVPYDIGGDQSQGEIGLCDRGGD
jgi:hypothetical protein